MKTHVVMILLPIVIVSDNKRYSIAPASVTGSQPDKQTIIDFFAELGFYNIHSRILFTMHHANHTAWRLSTCIKMMISTLSVPYSSLINYMYMYKYLACIALKKGSYCSLWFKSISMKLLAVLFVVLHKDSSCKNRTTAWWFLIQ